MKHMNKIEEMMLDRIYELEQKVDTLRQDTNCKALILLDLEKRIKKLEGKLYLATLDRLEGVTFGEYKNEWSEETAAADLIGSSREYIEVDSEETAILEEWIAEAEASLPPYTWEPPILATKNIEVTGKKECNCKPCVCMSNSESDNE